jgi:hypothetical protein
MRLSKNNGGTYSFGYLLAISDVSEIADGSCRAIFTLSFLGEVHVSFESDIPANNSVIENLHDELMRAFLDDNSPGSFRIRPGFILELGTPKEIKLPGDFEDAMGGLLGQLKPPAVLVPGGAQGSTNAPPGDWQASLQLLMRDVDDQIGYRPNHQSSGDVQALLEAIRVEIPSIAVRVLGPTPTETGRIN